jgi:cytochrome b subunit of formate dehydrogenase
LVVGSWTLGVMVSGVIFFTIFNRPVEKVDDIRNDLRIVKIAILLLVVVIIGVGIYVGIQSGY